MNRCHSRNRVAGSVVSGYQFQLIVKLLILHLKLAEQRQHLGLAGQLLLQQQRFIPDYLGVKPGFFENLWLQGQGVLEVKLALQRHLELQVS